VPQVRFHFDYSGGWRRYHDASYWKTFRDAAVRTTGRRSRGRRLPTSASSDRVTAGHRSCPTQR